MIEELFGLWLSGLDWNYVIITIPYWGSKILYWKVKYLSK